MAVACFTYGWGCWCACLFLGACSVGAWKQWRWRVLRAGSVGLLLRRRILVEVRTLLCGAYSGCGWAPPYLCVWSGHLAAGHFLCTAPGPVAVSVFCVWSSPVARCVASPSCGVYFVYGRGLLCGAYSGHGWGLAAWRVFRVRLGAPTAGRVIGFGFILFVMRWIVPLCLILTEFSPHFPERVPKPCAETSYLRVQCLCGRADVWSARAVGATILDVFGYGLPTESGVGSQWRYCYCRGREVGNHSEKDMGSLGKFAFIPSSHLKI